MSSRKTTPAKRGPKPSDLERGSLGWHIRRARNKKDWSARELGDKVGVSHASIIRTENGTTTPDKTTLIRMAQELGDDFGLRELARYAKKSLTDVPVVAYVAGGKPIVEDIRDEFVKIDPALVRVQEDVCGLKVRGDSMVGEHILNGDTLICRRADPKNISKGTIVVVDLKGERGASVKRWEFKNETIYLYADKNAKNEDKQAFHNWEFGTVFEILGLVRSFK